MTEAKVSTAVRKEREAILIELETAFLLAPQDDSYFRLLIKRIQRGIQAGRYIGKLPALLEQYTRIFHIS